MAKLELTIDTNTREISVSIDGEPVPDVCSVSAYLSPDAYGGDSPEPHFTVVTCERGGSGYRRQQYLTASDRPSAVASYFGRVFGPGRAGTV